MFQKLTVFNFSYHESRAAEVELCLKVCGVIVELVHQKLENMIICIWTHHHLNRIYRCRCRRECFKKVKMFKLLIIFGKRVFLVSYLYNNVEGDRGSKTHDYPDSSIDNVLTNSRRWSCLRLTEQGKDGNWQQADHETGDDHHLVELNIPNTQHHYNNISSQTFW